MIDERRAEIIALYNRAVSLRDDIERLEDKERDECDELLERRAATGTPAEVSEVTAGLLGSAYYFADQAAHELKRAKGEDE